MRWIVVMVVMVMMVVVVVVVVVVVRSLWWVVDGGGGCGGVDGCGCDIIIVVVVTAPATAVVAALTGQGWPNECASVPGAVVMERQRKRREEMRGEEHREIIGSSPAQCQAL
jgi:hypothetical protein